MDFLFGFRFEQFLSLPELMVGYASPKPGYHRHFDVVILPLALLVKNLLGSQFVFGNFRNEGQWRLKRLHCKQSKPSLGGGGGNIRGIAVFSNPPLCVKKVLQPQFFPKERHTGQLLEAAVCCFIWCKCSLHNALRLPNIPHSAGTNLVALHIVVGPKSNPHKARVLAVGPQELWLVVKLVKMLLVLPRIVALARLAN